MLFYREETLAPTQSA